MKRHLSATILVVTLFVLALGPLLAHLTRTAHADGLVEVYDAGVVTDAPPIADPGIVSVDDPSEAVGVIAKVLQAITSGDWKLAAIFAIVLVVAGLRMFAGKFGQLAWFRSRWGGWCLALVGTTAGYLAMVISTGGDVTWASMSQGVSIGLAAAGTKELLTDAKKD